MTLNCMQQNILASYQQKMCGGVLPMKKLMFLVSLIPILTFFSTALSQSEENLDQEIDDDQFVTYIVQVSKPDGVNASSSSSENLHAWYHSFLPRSDSGETTRHLLYTYRNVIHGFAVKMTAKELKAMEKKKGFVSARPERLLSLHTTHSPNFLGLMNRNFRLWRGSNFGKGIIIGVIDTGIWPEHPSFSDEGMPPPPAKWKGICEFNGLSKCNNKIIGARNLADSSSDAKTPPFDHIGHGTHTASTAAGNFVNHAGVFGNAEGIASGMAPYAHLAIYKACNHEGCRDSAILASMDAAIDDGVDILSMSLGSSSLPFFEDIMAVGGFSATMKGIVVSTSAGNAGPDYSTLSNEAPWLLTVGASTIDRSVKVTAKLGNGVEYDGESLFQPKDLNLTSLPLMYAASQNQSSVFCAPGSLVNANAKGKVVLCERGGQVGRIQKGQEVKNAGGVAMILINQEKDGFTILADPHVLPAAHVSYETGVQIKAYIKSSLNPQATISFEGTVTGFKVAPAVASFSSRGPNTQSPGILKPDVIGPGVNILAAWKESMENNDHDNSSTFNMISGTSMSCPHLSGIAALLKSSHPDWSPAAIKSAIMTTADLNNLGYKPILDQKLEPADLLAIGAGHVHPSKANDPGLVYDLHPDDYIPYLCGLGYSKTSMTMILQRVVDCSKVQSIPEAQLNYPSFSISMRNASQYYTRTLTNVGPAYSTYSVEVHVPLAFGMIVKPTTIAFTEVNQKVSYSVEFIPGPKDKRVDGEYTKGYLRWVSDRHTVTSPISVTFK